jgi:signal transduction histidine kinase
VRGVRGRLTITLVTLVVLTAAVLGVGSYLFVDYSLHERAKADAAAEATFDLTVLIPDRLGGEVTRERFEASGLEATFAIRGGIRVVADFGDLPPTSIVGLLSRAFVAAIESNQVAFEWASVAERRSLITGGRIPGTTVPVYFLRDISDLESALNQLRLALGGGALLLTLLALVAARWVARGVLAPVEAAGRAAERIERGDLSARVPVNSTDEFGSWAERFNRMAATLEETISRLEASQAQNRRFVADVSHELRTPVTALVAEASILREHLGDLPPDARRTGELLVTDVARLRILVDELMELSRFDAAAEELRREPHDLVRLVRAVATARLPEAEVHLPSEPMTVATDARRLERILGNLLDNAREHAPGSVVEVRLGRDGPMAVITVADRGPGIPEDRLGRIFERFYKADPSRHGGSSGLGLAIAAEHAALLGGQLRAANRDGGGTRFELRVPVTEPLPGGDGMANGWIEGEGRQTATLESLRGTAISASSPPSSRSVWSPPARPRAAVSAPCPRAALRIPPSRRAART